MDDGLKQRLIGAFVLLALGVIFIPVLFDRDRIEPVSKKTQIPAAPHVEPVVIEELTPPDVENPAVVPEKMYIPDEDYEISETPELPSVDQKGVPNSWVIQVASFRFEKHAQDLRDKLITDGYAAYTRTIIMDKGKMTRLYVGPKIDKRVILRQKKEIDAKYKVTTMLLKFEP